MPEPTRPLDPALARELAILVADKESAAFEAGRDDARRGSLTVLVVGFTVGFLGGIVAGILLCITMATTP